MLTRAIVLAERWKICDMRRRRDVCYFVKTFTCCQKSETEEEFSPLRRSLPRVHPATRIALEPLQLGVGLEQQMPEFPPLMPLARRGVELGRHVVAPQRPVHFHRLRH